jgi:hypothetical protein
LSVQLIDARGREERVHGRRGEALQEVEQKSTPFFRDRRIRLPPTS